MIEYLLKIDTVRLYDILEYLEQLKNPKPKPKSAPKNNADEDIKWRERFRKKFTRREHTNE